MERDTALFLLSISLSFSPMVETCLLYSIEVFPSPILEKSFLFFFSPVFFSFPFISSFLTSSFFLVPCCRFCCYAFLFFFLMSMYVYVVSPCLFAVMPEKNIFGQQFFFLLFPHTFCFLRLRSFCRSSVTSGVFRNVYLSCFPSPSLTCTFVYPSASQIVQYLSYRQHRHGYTCYRPLFLFLWQKTCTNIQHMKSKNYCKKFKRL